MTGQIQLTIPPRAATLPVSPRWPLWSAYVAAVVSGAVVLVGGFAPSVAQTPTLTLSYYLRMNVDTGACARRLPDDQVDLVVEVFRMLADATRVQILWTLVRGEMSVGELAGHVAKPAPSVSQHLAKLRMARLVRTRREGTTIYYSLDNDHVRQLVTDAVFNAEHAGPGVPGHHRQADELRILHTETAPTGQSQLRGPRA